MKKNHSEILRKTVHFSGIFLIPVLLWNRAVFALFMGSFACLYVAREILKARGHDIPFLGHFIDRCKRPSEKGRLSLGVLFLGLSGVMMPYFFGSHVAAIALSQLFVADVASTWIGRRWGKQKLPFSPSKSWVGSLSFFGSAFLTGLFFVSVPQAFLLSLIGMLAESLPIPESDNLLIPILVGGCAKVIGV